MTAKRVLLPYNFTPLDQKALAFVISIFGKVDKVFVTLFNVYTPMPEIEADAAFVTGKLKGNLSYLFQNIKENEAELNQIKDQLVAAGFSENRVDCIYRSRKKDIAYEIIDLAETEDFDFIVHNRKHGRVTRFFSGSTSHKVMINLKGQTVCIVS